LPIEPIPDVPELNGPQPVEVFVRRALAENRTVQAAFHNVRSLEHRIPQVTALDDPVASNAVFPIPSVAPQYFLMGYNPYNLTLAQQFPWFGTLRLRGEAAGRDVQIALAELAAAQLDAVATVKRAYYNLHASLKTEEILGETRKVLENFREIARERLKSGGSQEDLRRSEIMTSELDRELATNRQAITSARAILARQLHVPPDARLATLPDLSLPAVPEEIERLDRLAISVRPELQGRLAALARDEKAIELARKRFYPSITLGLTYMDMERTNAIAPRTANGSPNVGLFVGFNLPVHQAKYRAGVAEAEERALADAKVFEAQRDETLSEIQDLVVQAKVQENVLTLLRDSILPRTRASLELARSDYAKSNVDYATVLAAVREVLQVQIQLAQVEAELDKALAGLERAVGCQINVHAPAVGESAESTTTRPPAAPDLVPPLRNSPFRTTTSAPDPGSGRPGRP
jgi:outer membrane protein TolC